MREIRAKARQEEAARAAAAKAKEEEAARAASDKIREQRRRERDERIYSMAQENGGGASGSGGRSRSSDQGSNASPAKKNAKASGSASGRRAGTREIATPLRPTVAISRETGRGRSTKAPISYADSLHIPKKSHKAKTTSSKKKAQKKKQRNVEEYDEEEGEEPDEDLGDQPDWEVHLLVFTFVVQPLMLTRFTLTPFSLTVRSVASPESTSTMERSSLAARPAEGGSMSRVMI